MKLKQLAVISLSSVLVLGACGQNDSGKKEGKQETQQKEDTLKKYKENLKTFVNKDLDTYDNTMDKLSNLDLSNKDKIVKEFKSVSQSLDESRKNYESKKVDAKTPETLSKIESSFLESNKSVSKGYNGIATSLDKFFKKEISEKEFAADMKKYEEESKKVDMGGITLDDIKKHLGEDTAKKYEKVQKRINNMTE
ncbi:hypothetical protein [Staphylococcus agnetis]|uniref:hypothetical protein n=1 Tax=Staphylococcus agnetis TaxID=985762 RepID=UPI00143088D5|nr:hypothetical protein [Staphylococcus agnetis]NJH97116.1 hypothetical protein [Staphylococcus agnetis]